MIVGPKFHLITIDKIEYLRNDVSLYLALR